MDYFEKRDNICMQEETNNIILFENAENDSEIQKFYENKNVLITGATGLIGSLLVEHLLRLCPNLGKIFLLMRSIKSKSPEERLQELFSLKMFHKVHKIHRDAKIKTHIIYGDCAQPWCAISEYDQKILIDNVHIVYHSATANSINENFRNTYYVNVRATEHLLKMAAKMKHIQAFIHISTAYRGGVLTDMKEKFYEVPFSIKELQYLEENLDNEHLAAIIPMIVGLEANNNTFTKAVAEDVVQRYIGKIPIAVARPCKVVSYDKKPLINLMNNIHGDTEITVEAFMGAIKIGRFGEEETVHIIPADKVVSTLVAISWQIGSQISNGNKPTTPIYNIFPSPKSSITWNEYMNFIEHFATAYQNSSKHFNKDYKICLEHHKGIHYLQKFSRHILLRVLIDLFLKINKQSPNIIKPFTKKNHIYHVEYSIEEWVCEQPNVKKLWLQMSSLDKKLFDFDMSSYDWKQFNSRSTRSFIDDLFRNDYIDAEKLHKKKNLLTKGCMNVGVASMKIVTYCISVYFFNDYLLSLLKFVNTLFL